MGLSQVTVLKLTTLLIPLDPNNCSLGASHHNYPIHLMVYPDHTCSSSTSHSKPLNLFKNSQNPCLWLPTVAPIVTPTMVPLHQKKD